ncbi:dihydroorotate dehydrogenase electron transfer subunit [Heliobacterium gestii]|uniref:Dihydroorotate dehydrogenase B (NAD(+)), electron transfer subunit n=1 Tax=Heliomicrobium gestii TaxID=2699 RepID=A0A845LKF0_HELGE|nr:dihydroorotate dehydrogenase electron transfer subunit [Heliomicrobium gestii]MBM7867580.1 dihydroorotate dehydrogenase electron transfer subunit [Heliomicrobium gestii]MZP43873.1 dihydroorotate dehydrogenase electron transfer subunit [Heliomicrobium gestii]
MPTQKTSSINSSAVLADAVILSQEELKAGFFRLVLAAPELARRCQPGQFVQVRVSDGVAPLLPRPISIHSFDGELGILSLLYHVAGQGTGKLSRLPAGESLRIWGPLGKGWSLPENLTDGSAAMPAYVDIDKEKTLPVFVAGGIGIAPLPPLAKAWRNAGSEALLLYGARSAGQIVTVDEFTAMGVDVRIATEDGSAGVTGRVTELLKELDRKGKEPLLYVCGPKPMLQAVAQLADERGWLCQVSLEERMCCGLGACLSCVCKKKTDDQKEGGKGWTHAKVCTDGPVFWSREVVWNG